MRFLGILVCLISILEAKLVPTPFFMNFQRVGRDSTLTHFGKKLFHDCYGIAMVKPRETNSTLLVVSDPDWCRLIYIRVYEQNEDFEYLRQFGGYGSTPSQFMEPKGLCIDTTVYNNNDTAYAIYVADSKNRRISTLKYKITTDTIVTSGILASGLENPTDVACVSKPDGGAYIVIVEKDAHRIRLSKRKASGSDSLIQNYGSQGSGYGNFFQPNGAAICAATDGGGGYFIYVTDTGNRRVVCLRYKPNEGISWKSVYRTFENAQFLSVTASQYYCVYVTDFLQNKIWVFTHGLDELLYTYGNSELLNGPKDVYIDWDRIGLTERWTAGTGIQYFKIIPEVKIHPEKSSFDATVDSVGISFDVYETAGEVTIRVAGQTIMESQHFEPGLDYFAGYWDGRDGEGMVVVPGNHLIRALSLDHISGSATVAVQGTKIENEISDLHWIPAGNPYVLVDGCLLQYDDTLIIDPGVLVMGHTTNTQLEVHGILKAIGTANDSVIFTSHRKLAPPDPTNSGMWRGIMSDFNSAQNEIKFCQIEYADVGLEIWSDFYSAVVINVIENSYFYTNTLPARCDFYSTGAFGYWNEYIDNDVNKIEVMEPPSKDSPSGDPSDDIINDITIKDQDIPFWFRLTYVFKYQVGGSETEVMTLIIEPGTRLEFDENTALEIGIEDQWGYERGRILAEGLENDSITFTGVEGGFWKGIRFCSTSCIEDTSVISYASIEYAGQDTASIVLGDSTSINITNSRIYKSNKYGIWMPEGSPYDNIVLSNCLFEEDSIPVITSFGNLSGLNTCSFLDNENDIIEVLGHNGVHKDINIAYQLVPYYFLNRTPYGSDFAMYGEDTLATLTIDPGTNIQCEDEVRLSIGQIDQNNRGNIIASGNDSTPIVFTAIDQSNPWHGIRLYAYDAQDTSIFEHCEISHTNGAGIQIYNTSPTIKNSVITNSENGIIVSGSDANPLIEGNLITLNYCGVHNTNEGSTLLELHNNDIFANKIALRNDLESYDINATLNWFGDVTGPWDPTEPPEGPPDYNQAGRGDSIGDYVVYRPWLDAPVHEQVLTLIQPNGGDTLYGESEYEIQWSVSVTPTRQELYYTTDFPEGGSVREEALWRLIDTVNINDTSYLWHVPLTLSNRCRVAIKIFYDTETERQGDKEKIKQGISLSGNQEIRGFENDATRGLVALQNDNNEHKEQGSLHSKYTDQYLSLQSLTNENLTGIDSKDKNPTQSKKAISQHKSDADLRELSNENDIRGGTRILVDISDGNFAIVDTISPQITLIAPNGGEYFIPTKAETIKWQASDNHKLGHFNIYLSTDGGTNYSTTIIEDLEAPCSTYAWVPSAENAYKCKVKVVAYDSSDNNDNDVSDDLFYIPVKSYLNEMTAYNNARRLIRSFFSILHLVYTTQSESGENKRNQGLAREIEDRNDATRGLAPPIEDERGLVAPQSNNNKYKGRSTSKICYIKSTDGGNLWFSDTELGDGIYPSMAMDNDANKIGVAWTNSTSSKILYKYWRPLSGWSGLCTIFNEALDITYSPVAIQFAKDSIHLVSLRTTQITSSELVQDVLYHKFPWTDPSSCATMETIDHWRIAYENPLPEFVSIAVDYDGIAHLAWERPPGDTMFTTPTPFDIFYALRGGLFITDKYNISNSDDNSIHPSADCYGGHCYVVWQEKVNGYNVFLYKRNYVQFPPKPETDTISQTSGNSVYPVSRMGGVVLWAEGDPAEIYGRIWNSRKEYWLEIENWSNTPDNSMYPQVDAWHNMGSTDIIGAWTENTDTCGLGKRFVSFWPSKDHADISFPSYCLTLGDSMSTPFTEYRDTIATYQEDKFDLGVDSLVYYLPYINANAQCRIMIELYRPDVSEGSTPGKENKPKGSTPNKDSNWKIRLNLDGIMHRIIKLAPGELKTLELDVPWLVNINGSARIKFKKMRGDFILVRRILFYEYERGEKDTGSFLVGGGPQSDETMQVSPVFFEGLYPNPAKGNLKIRFNSPDEQKVTIKLYDVTGRLINEIFNGKAKIGMNEMPIMAENYAAGIYFVRIETDKEIITEKFIMLK